MDVSSASPLQTAPLILASDTVASAALQTMRRSASSCILVINRTGQLSGIFTERDAVRAIAAGRDFDQLPLGELMTCPALAIPAAESDNLLYCLERLRQHRIRHLPVVGEQQEPLGLVTASSLRAALGPTQLMRCRSVASAMVRRVDTATLETPLQALAQQLAANQRSGEHWLAIVLEGTGDCVYEWNAQSDGKECSSSCWMMLGYGPDHLTGHDASCLDLIHPEDRDRVAATFQAYLQRQLPQYQVEYRLRHRDGSYRRVQARTGRPLRVVGVRQDVTDRKRLEQELADSLALREATFHQFSLRCAERCSGTGGRSLDVVGL